MVKIAVAKITVIAPPISPHSKGAHNVEMSDIIKSFSTEERVRVRVRDFLRRQ